MVSKKELKDYEFADITEYYDYILESKQNGQHNQAKELFGYSGKLYAVSGNRILDQLKNFIHLADD